MPLCLASASDIRRTMLEAAGIPHVVVPAAVDELPFKERETDPPSLARALAIAKASSVSALRLDDWVIGSDSVVEVDGRLFSKPRDRDEAAAHLRSFSGKLMKLSSAVALARRGVEDWSVSVTARLHVRPLSEMFIDEYLDAEWPQVSYCVGVFRMEDRGVQLFDRIEGDHFTILGMPLLPLLSALRARGVLTS